MQRHVGNGNIFWYRYLTINNSAKKQHFSTKFGDRFGHLLGIKCTKFYSALFRFDIFIIQCLEVIFFRTQKTRANELKRRVSVCIA